ncbi:hypothetical protein N7478_012995 [Penicillium angulare]|uniref:uncharacterized protein n=1 Tax=Penicillium angulare TaxID=116970 RepID=UPI00254028BC|nr:uncharacterized protein N7478_012995 [Penicillium angulare]KAJ5256891.1 hypothetical protein N7478_012995 [Penicillium angulare]
MSPVSKTEVASPAATATTPTETSAQPSISTNPPVKTDNVNSKKRAKARKQGGLQALLASKPKTQPSLDLFDFLQ